MLQHIFMDHDFWFLAFAVVTCVSGASLGVVLWGRSLAVDMRDGLDMGFFAAVVLGTTIWTTHFLAMLGYDGSGGAIFDPLLTTLSLVVAVAGIATTIVLSHFKRSPPFVILSGTLLGLTISSMHFTGMLGYAPGRELEWGDIFSGYAVFAGAALGIAAVRLLHAQRGWRHTASAALLISSAIVAVHFLAMAMFHARMDPMPVGESAGVHTALGIAVTVATFLLIGTAGAGFFIQKRQSDASTARLRESAVTDALTGVRNREGFNRCLAHCIERYHCEQVPFSLLLIDLDRFKPVNDMFGHAVGDEVLRRVVIRLNKITRVGDVVSRLGGDEFALVAQDTAPGCPGVDALAARIVDLLNRPFLIDTRLIEIGASVGIAEPDEDGLDDVTRITQAADMALYSAKSQGRGRWLRYDPEIGRQFEEKRRLEYDLRRALARDELELHFQPCVNSQSGEFVAAEALIRWRHPTRGLLAPATFVPLAEEAGLITQIGKWVLERACATAAEWRIPLKVAVNVSPMQLRDPRIIQIVRNALEKSRLPPDRLDIEITENALLENEEQGIDILYRLRDIGVTISLDDFGTGFSSLSYLHRFPLDRLKIDRSFIAAAQSDPKSARIVEAISRLGTALDLGVTAEGVETREQMDLATANGCDVLQGFMISKPLPADDLSELFDLLTDDPTRDREIAS